MLSTIRGKFPEGTAVVSSFVLFEKNSHSFFFSCRDNREVTVTKSQMKLGDHWANPTVKHWCFNFYCCDVLALFFVSFPILLFACPI